MEAERRSLQIGTLVVAAALVLRILSGGFLEEAAAYIAKPEVASFLLYLETGRVIRSTGAPTVSNPTPETATPTPTPQPQPPAVFTGEDVALVEIRNHCGYAVDTEKLLGQPLSWNLKQTAPTVLILHSHGSESYEKTENYKEDTAYRTLDNGYNMVSVGNRVAELLEAQGIRVIHDETLHDYPSFNGAYDHSRTAIREYLAQNPEICLVLDLHRDAAETADGGQYRSSVSTPKGTAAQLMLVVGTDAGGLEHPEWQENLALGVKLYAQLEKQMPGICRPINFCAQRFNQDLSPGALLVEVGAAGNTRQEALLAAEYLAEAIAQLAGGATTDSTS